MQERDPSSTLKHYRHALAFRRVHPALVKGAQSTPRVEGDVVSFVRTHEDEEIFCAFNLSDTPSDVHLPEGDWHQIGVELNSAAATPGGTAHLGPWQVCLALKQ